jgi:2-methylisocitrate lyase-like PEP mutase family enzyme
MNRTTEAEALIGDDQRRRAAAFHEMHHGDRPLQIVNVWDATSARVAAATGAGALGTSSFAVAFDHGVADGEHLSFSLALAALGEVVDAVDLPVSVDLEAGRGAGPTEVAASTSAVIERGAVGMNIEDAVPDGSGVLFDVQDQSDRLAAARGAADAVDVQVFLNARCDVWFGADVEPSRRLDEVRRRVERYAAAGADGLFLPGLADLDILAAVTAETDLVVNVMVDPTTASVDDLAAAGVGRISQGGGGFLAVVGAMRAVTEQYLGGALVPPLDLFGTGLSVLPQLAS